MSYHKPNRSDMAVCLVYFNSTKSKRLLMNYLFTVEKLKLAGIKYYTIELYFDSPEISDAIHFKGSSIMFHKEQLCHVLEPYVSWWYTKVLFLDADIIFEKLDWYDSVSELLDSHDIVQPFETCSWLNLSYKTIELSRESVVKQKHFKTYSTKFHPGFAWAFNRQWFRSFGFYRFAITGSGDTLSAAAWFGQSLDSSYNFPKALEASYNEYRKKISSSGPKGPSGLEGLIGLCCGSVGLVSACLPGEEETYEIAFNGPRVTYCPGRILHLYHGSRENRKYSDRHNMLNGILDIRKELKVSFYNIFSFRNPNLQALLKSYFEQRLDDEI